MYRIGLTGGIACGKSTVAGILRELGAEVLDADAIARQMTTPGGAAADAVLARFGTLDRRLLASVIFQDEDARQDLNDIVHPLVRSAMEAAIDKSKAKAVVLEVPLLYESGMESMTDEVWVAHIAGREQLRRVMARDGLSEADALARINSQMPAEEKLRRADVVIDTGLPIAHTRERVAQLWRLALIRADLKV